MAEDLEKPKIELDSIKGHIEVIIYVQPDNGFTVARLKEVHKKELTVIVGYLPSIQPGETVICRGIWKIHPSHGRQFDVSDCQVEIPSDLVGIQKYLESGLVRGVGPVFAKKIVERFGIDTLKVIDEAPERLMEISGLGKGKMEKIVECWQQQRSIRKVMIFLRAHGVSPAYAQKIFKAYGDESIERVSKNPYQLAKDIFGIGFKTADALAQQLGLPLHSPERISAGIQYVLWELTNDGHTCYPRKDLIPAARMMLDVEQDLVEDQMTRLSLSKELIHDDINGEPTIWLKTFYAYEQGIGSDLKRLLQSPQTLRSIDAVKACDWVQTQLGIEFAIQQKEAIRKALVDKIHIITGGPGTGKSTITNAILEISSKLTNKILLAAPTGRAAKRMSEITHRKAFTLHALLEWDPITGGFKRSRENQLPADLLIVDEASMIDTPLLFSLLRAIPSGTRVIFVGDIDQLPSVGPGTVLRDLIGSELIGITRLTEIYRQAKGSKIVTNAHRINHGEFPEIHTDEKSDFHFIEAQTPEAIQQIILQLVSREIPARHGFHPIEEIQVLSPMRRGVIGIENLNDMLQNTLNPCDKPFFRAGRRFHVKDKVMQIRNNYNKKTCNGDIGRIEKIDLEEQFLEVAFDDKNVEYDFSELDELVIAYAASVHKYQGSECPCIVLPIHTSHFKLLHRNLLYTGVTRGKKQVYLVGTKKAIGIAISNDQVLKRFTGLEKALKTASAGLPNARQLEFVPAKPG
ncbi:MAG: yrrC [Parachlamydiales bacterium]|nr:yrrC [Parachlamydiales bacterium]